MQELMKSHPTGSIEIRFIGPVEKRDQAIERLKPLGVVDSSEEYVSWRELFSEYSNEEMQGSRLRGARYKKSITQRQLADMIGIPQRHISMMENGKYALQNNLTKY